MKTQVSYQFNGLNYVATLNHENWKTFGKVKDQGFRGNDAAEKAAIEAIEKGLAA